MIDDTGSTEYWADVRKAKQTAAADWREKAPQVLQQNGVLFVSKNQGAHLIVEGKLGFIDYWPGTGKWISREGTKGFGLTALLAFIKP